MRGKWQWTWPWDHSAAAKHTEHVEEQEKKVQEITHEASRQKEENHIAELLSELFTVTPRRDHD